eukprot:12089978-Alexandrium_andersonii.AAC.1
MSAHGSSLRRRLLGARPAPSAGLSWRLFQRRARPASFAARCWRFLGGWPLRAGACPASVGFQ